MARRILGGAIVPAAPVLLEPVSPRQPAAKRDEVAALRQTVERTLTGLPAADVVIVLDTGPRGVHQRVRADLAMLGIDHPPTDLPVPTDLVATATRIMQYPLVSSGTLPVSAAVLAVLVEATLGAVPMLVTTVPAKAAGEMLSHVGAGLVEAVRGSDVTGVVLSSGDLSAGLDEASPAYVVPDAAAWDEELQDAVNGQDLERLHELGPERATAAAARSWAAIVAAHGAFSAARLRPAKVEYHAPLGVGQLVASFEQQDDVEPGERFRRRAAGS